MSKGSKKSRMRRQRFAFQQKQLRAEKSRDQEAMQDLKRQVQDAHYQNYQLTERFDSLYQSVSFRVWWDSLLKMIVLEKGSKKITLIPKYPSEPIDWILVTYSEYEHKVKSSSKEIRDHNGYVVAYQESEGALTIPQAIGCHRVSGLSPGTWIEVGSAELKDLLDQHI